MSILFMLCGVPGSGKSTWIGNQKWDVSKVRVLSTDDIIQDIADRNRLSYNDVFGDVTYAFAEKMMHKLASLHFANPEVEIIVWDQTNLNPKTRARKLARVPGSWMKVAIYFNVPENLTERLASRPGKFIPPKVVENMINTYKIPTESEGFDSVISADTWNATKELVDQFGKKWSSKNVS